MELRIVNESDERLDLAFKGRLDAMATDEIGIKFYALLNQPEKPVYVDFSEVTFLASLGIRLLLNGLKMARKDGFSLHVTNPSEEIRKVFQMAGLDEILMQDL